MNAAITAALIIATAGLLASAVSAVLGALTQHRLSWYEARRPAYAAFLDAAAASSSIHMRAGDLLRTSRWDVRPLPAALKLRREVNSTAADLRLAIFSVQLVATPPVFEAADRMLNVVATGAAILGTVADDRKTWHNAADALDRLEKELLEARDDFVDRARAELRLAPLPKRASGRREVEALLADVMKNSHG